MEAKNKYNISKIETRLHTLLNKQVSDHTFVATLPSVLSENWDDMVLIDFETDVRDMDSYADGYSHVLLYARPLSDGTKNVAKMSQLEERLNEIINSTQSSDFVIARDSMMSDYDTNINWHCNIINLKIRVY